MIENPPCPCCKTNKHVELNGRDAYFCGKCSSLFDFEPNEGGDYFSDPSKRMERAEERAQRRPRRTFHR